MKGLQGTKGSRAGPENVGDGERLGNQVQQDHQALKEAKEKRLATDRSRCIMNSLWSGERGII